MNVYRLKCRVDITARATNVPRDEISCNRSHSPPCSLPFKIFPLLSSYLFEFDGVFHPGQVNGHHDEQVKDGDDNAYQLERLGYQHEAVVGDDAVNDGKVGAGQQLEAQQERSEGVRNHEGQDERDVGTSHLEIKKTIKGSFTQSE